MSADIFDFCSEPADPDTSETSAPTSVDVLRAFEEVPLPRTVLVVEPPGGETLVNFDTNFYTVAEPFTANVTVLDRAVELSIRPTTFTWEFGDGVVRETTTPGAAYPDLLVTHAYTRTGEVSTRVTTTWSANFRVDDGPWRSIEGSVAQSSAPVSLRIREATPVLTD